MQRYIPRRAITTPPPLPQHYLDAQAERDSVDMLERFVFLFGVVLAVFTVCLVLRNFTE